MYIEPSCAWFSTSLLHYHIYHYIHQTHSLLFLFFSFLAFSSAYWAYSWSASSWSIIQNFLYSSNGGKCISNFEKLLIDCQSDFKQQLDKKKKSVIWIPCECTVVAKQTWETQICHAEENVAFQNSQNSQQSCFFSLWWLKFLIFRYSVASK